MPETATVVIKELLPKKSEKAPAAAKDGNGTIYKRWDGGFDEYVDKRVKLTYEVKSRDYNGRTFTDNIVSEVEPVEEQQDPDHPPLGTGEYVRGQTAPNDARRIAASVAWNDSATITAAVLGHMPGREITPDLACEVSRQIATYIFTDLLRKGRMMDEEDVPFG